jgi:hypothetical protein
MNPRHAAALSLVGWYLLAPPVREVHQDLDEWDASEPLSKWKLVDSFDTADQCRNELYRRTNLKDKQNRKPTVSEKHFLESFMCIASDDPRLVK